MAAGPTPDPDATLTQFDSLRFGDPLASARFLGRPERLQWRSRIRRDCDALYAKQGLRLRFRGDRLTELTFLIGPHSNDHPAFVPAQPKAPNGTRLTPEVDRAQIVALFGEPDPKGSDETCLQVFHDGRVISDFYLDGGGHLERWVLYPDD